MSVWLSRDLQNRAPCLNWDQCGSWLVCHARTPMTLFVSRKKQPLLCSQVTLFPCLNAKLNDFLHLDKQFNPSPSFCISFNLSNLVKAWDGNLLDSRIVDHCSLLAIDRNCLNVSFYQKNWPAVSSNVCFPGIDC